MVFLGACAWLVVMCTNAINRRRLALAAVVVVTAVTGLVWRPAAAQCTVECRAVPEPAVTFAQVWLPMVETGARGEGRGAPMEDGPVVGPGPCHSDTPWGCYTHQVWLAAVMAE